MRPQGTPPAAGLTVHLVRHAESEANAGGMVLGSPADSPLSDRGRAQAGTTAAALDALGPIDRVLSSDLLRAMQTAELIAATAGVTVEAEPRLRERGVASFDATTVAARLGREDTGETTMDIALRVGSLLVELMITVRTGVVVLVTHADTIRVAANWLAATAADRDFGWPDFGFANGSVTTAFIENGVVVDFHPM